MWKCTMRIKKKVPIKLIVQIKDKKRSTIGIEAIMVKEQVKFKKTVLRLVILDPKPAGIGNKLPRMSKKVKST